MVRHPASLLPLVDWGWMQIADFVLSGLLWVTIIVAVATLVLTSMPNFTADWENGRFNSLPLWGGVALGYRFTSLVLAKLKREWAAGRGAS